MTACCRRKGVAFRFSISVAQSRSVERIVNLTPRATFDMTIVAGKVVFAPN